MVDFETISQNPISAQLRILACEAVPKSKETPEVHIERRRAQGPRDLKRYSRVLRAGELVGKTAIAIVNLPPRKMMGIDSEGMLISAVHEKDGHEGLNLLMVDDRIPAGAKLY